MDRESSHQENDEREIDVEKGIGELPQRETIKSEGNRYTKQQFMMEEIISELSDDRFDKESTYKDLKEYVRKYDRILYSTVSHRCSKV